jgi:hypothetical protein
VHVCTRTNALHGRVPYVIHTQAQHIMSVNCPVTMRGRGLSTLPLLCHPLALPPYNVVLLYPPPSFDHQIPPTCLSLLLSPFR